MTESSIQAALLAGKERLAALSDSPALDAQVLLAHILKQDRAWLLAHDEELLDARQLELWEWALGRLEAGEALPYVIGEWEFFGLKFFVSPAVLIPRPETELLVETALSWLAKNPDRTKVLDIGTGSGCIAVAIAKNAAQVEVTASDVSQEALEVALSNVERHGLKERIGLVHSDLLEDVTGHFDLLCANLPYIADERLSELEVYEREPTIALGAGEEGLALIRRQLSTAPEYMLPGALLLLEIDISQNDSAAELAKGYFADADIDVLEDLSGRPRLLRIQT